MVFRFGPFDLDPASGALRKHGVRIKAGSQPLDILIALLERPGEVVTREELRARLWPDGVHVDFEHNLNKAVNRLRDVLNDSAERPRYIETIPKRGYRLIPPVERVEITKPETQPPAAAPKPRAPRRRLIAVAAVVTLGLIVAAVSLSRRSGVESAWKPVPLTSYVGRESSASFSPDGSSIAFVWDGEEQDNIDIYVLSVGAPNPVRLTRDAAKDYSPAWSPDGSLIAFLRDLDGDRAAVYVIPPAGGEPRRVATVTSPPAAYTSFAIPARTIAWSRDGRHLIVPDSHSADTPFALFAVSVADGSMRRLTTPQRGRGDLGPAIAPDGNWLAFLRGGVAHTAEQIWLAEITPDLALRGEPRRLEIPHPWVDSLEWIASGQLLFAAAGTLDGSRSLYRVPALSAGGPQLVAGLGPDIVQPAVAAHSPRLAYTRLDSRVSSIWRLRLSATGSPDSPPERLSSSTSSNMDADLSPDGRRIAFRSLRSGVPEIWISNVDGSGLTQVKVPGAESAGNPRWSPDGRSLALHARVKGKSDIYITDLGAGSPRRLTTDAANNIVPTWSRDGNWIYFSANHGGALQLWRMPRNGGPAVQWTRNAGACPAGISRRRYQFLHVIQPPPKALRQDRRLRRRRSACGNCEPVSLRRSAGRHLFPIAATAGRLLRSALL
jgi:Tol biopolymer transport system component/DNA-binding winged helix-turn-helix (wHTH) protein